jgi:hypothetical protein
MPVNYVTTDLLGTDSFKLASLVAITAIEHDPEQMP